MSTRRTIFSFRLIVGGANLLPGPRMVIDSTVPML